MRRKRKIYKLSDQLIGQIRELLQLSLLTGTYIVDHMRAMILEEDPKNPGKLFLAKEYVEGWNKMIQELAEQAEKRLENDNIIEKSN
ncbi:MAG: hypothetical protein QXO21_01890 [Candidatus Anstonellales archaeon]